MYLTSNSLSTRYPDQSNLVIKLVKLIQPIKLINSIKLIDRPQNLPAPRLFRISPFCLSLTASIYQLIDVAPLVVASEAKQSRLAFRLKYKLDCFASLATTTQLYLLIYLHELCFMLSPCRPEFVNKISKALNLVLDSHLQGNDIDLTMRRVCDRTLKCVIKLIPLLKFYLTFNFK